MVKRIKMEMPDSFAHEDAAPSLLCSELADMLSSLETAKMTNVKKHTQQNPYMKCNSP